MPRLMCLVGVAVLALAGTAASAPGDLDRSFGRGGRVLTDFGGQREDVLRALVLEPGGSVVAVGTSFLESSECCPSEGAIARYRANGNLDRRFAGDGRRSLVVREPDGLRLNDAVRQPDGKLVVAGSRTTGERSRFVLLRVRRDGSLDPDFGRNGLVETEVADEPAGSYAAAVALQRDGRIVVAGSAGDAVAVARYGRNGSLDGAFGTGGLVVTDLASRSEYATAIALQADGRLVVGAGTQDPAGYALVRYRSDGRLDDRFGAGGVVLEATGPDGSPSVSHLALRSDGTIVAAGPGLVRGDHGIALARFDGAGRLDRRFGAGGKTRTTLGGPGDAALQPDGRIVVVGERRDMVAVARYLPSGARDPSFGRGRPVVAGQFGTGFPTARGTAVAVQPDGGIVAAGWSEVGHSEGADFALARFLGGR